MASLRIGWIGTGVMGVNMARHCLTKGFTDFSAYNRTSSKLQPLIELGAKQMDSPRAVAENSDVVFTMLGYPSDVRDVVLDPEKGVLTGLPKAGIIVDMTTSEPSLAVEVSEAAKSAGKFALDAPVSGGDVGARNGTLSVFVGGEGDVLERVKPILETFSGTVAHMGPAGCGQHTKAGNQVTICTAMIGMCEGLMYAHAAGLDLEKYLQAISKGAAGSFSLTVYGPRIIKGDLNPGFYVEHFVKDLGIAVGEAQRMKLALPGLGLAHQLYLSLLACGDGRLGTQSLIRAVERLNSRRVC